jgi:hypothetical protein
MITVLKTRIGDIWFGRSHDFGLGICRGDPLRGNQSLSWFNAIRDVPPEPFDFPFGVFFYVFIFVQTALKGWDDASANGNGDRAPAIPPAFGCFTISILSTTGESCINWCKNSGSF